MFVSLVLCASEASTDRAMKCRGGELAIRKDAIIAACRGRGRKIKRESPFMSTMDMEYPRALVYLAEIETRSDSSLTVTPY